MSGPAQNDSGFTTTEGTPLVLLPGQLLANDPAGTSILEIGNAVGGTVAYDGNGNIVFTPDPEYSGAASFEYLALDDQGEISVASVGLTVAPTNAAPQAAGDTGFVTVEDTPIFISGSVLLQNDSDPDGDAFAIAGIADAVGGTAVLDAQGNITFTPQANYHGPASFTYTISDGNGGFDTATVDISVTAVNDSPVATGNSFTFNEDTVLTLTAGQLLSNDGDVDGDALSIAGVSDPVGGTVAIDGNGNIVFTPLANYNGPASFQYAVSDGNGGFSTTTVDLTITPVNDKPVVVNDNFTLAEDTPLQLSAADLLGNDYDIEGGTLSILAVTAAQHGTVAKDAQGNVTFTPAADYNGPASFKYVVSDGQGGFTTGTVNLTVTPVNDAPVAGNDGVLVTAEDTPLTIQPGDLLANDSDIDGDTLGILSVQDAVGGSVALDQSGNVVFTPGANYNGPASFSYTISDGNGGTATATVNLDVTPVNDAPVAGNDGVLATAEDTPLTIQPGDLLANDSDIDGDALSILSVQDAVGGSVALDQSGNVVFTPGANYNGPASFSYTISDGNGGTATATVNLDVTPVNDAPVAGNDGVLATAEDTPLTIQPGDLLANDSDIDGDALGILSVQDAVGGSVALDQSGNVVFTPGANYNGPASFSYTISDGNGGTATATVSLNVTPVNDAPEGIDSAVSGTEDTSYTFSAGDFGFTDVDGDTLAEIRIDSLPAGAEGSLSLNGAAVTAGQVISAADLGGLVYTPAANVNGPAGFTFSVGDGQLFDPAPNTMTVNVAPVNDAPDAVDDGGSAGGGLALSTISVQAATGLYAISTLQTGDVNADGVTDIFARVQSPSHTAADHGVIFGAANSLATVLNGGSFAAAAANGPQTIKVGAINAFTGLADMNGDGTEDIIHATGSYWASPTLGVLSGSAAVDNVDDATLIPGIGYAGGSAMPVSADFNGDGQIDLFVSVHNSSAGNGGASATTPALALWLGNAAGISGSPTSTAYTGVSPVGQASLASGAYAMGAIDINGDGYDDVVTVVGARNDGQTNYGPTKITFGNAPGTLEQNLASNTGGLILNNFNFAGGDPLGHYMATGGDVNGDGLADMAGWAANYPSNATGGFVLFGDDAYAAGGSVDIAALNGQNGVKLTGLSAGISSMALGDLNGDGLADMVVGSTGMNAGAGRLWVVWGQQGGFASGNIDLSQTGDSRFITIDGAAGQGIGSALTVADIDGDGVNDLVVGSTTGTIDVISGEQFEGMVAAPLPGYTAFEDTPLSIDPAQLLANDSDIDGDTLAIQSVQDAVGGTVSLDQNGNVVFTPAASHTGPASFTYTISDGNGGTDTATVHLTVKPDDMALSAVSVRAATNMSTIYQLHAGDINGDGVTDLMAETSLYTSGGNGLIFGQAGSLTTQLNGGSFAAAATNGPAVFKFTSYNDVVGIGDINNDGYVDTINGTGSTTASVYLGGPGTDNVTDQNLALGIGYSPSGNPLVTDFNGDGHADLFMSVGNSSAVNGASATSPALAMWFGSSNGIANTPNATAYSGVTPVGVASLANVAYALGATDLNGDGYADIVTNVGARNDGQANYGPAKVTFGNAAGSFAANLASSDGGLILSNFEVAGGDPLARSVATGGDVNGDGLQDLAGWNESGTGGFVLFGNSGLTAGSTVNIGALNGEDGVRFTGTGSVTTEIALGDLNGDGIDDIVVGSQAAASGAGKLWVVWGQDGGFSSGSIDLSQESTGQFITLTGASGQGIGSALAITDMDGDGLNDLVVGSSSGTIDVVSGQQFGASLIGAMAAFSAPAGGLEATTPLTEEQQYQLASPV